MKQIYCLNLFYYLFIYYLMGAFYCLTGKFSHKIESGHLFVPRRVHSNGTHLTYNVTHYHRINDENAVDSDFMDNKLHYHIDLPDETMHIELEYETFCFLCLFLSFVK